jgi:chromosome segregation ATPase
MKSNPSEELLRALILSYPSASRERDFDGNLPIHYLLSEGCENKNIIDMLLNANPESIGKRDRKGRSLIELVSEGFRSGKLKKDTMVNILALLRQWSINEDRSLSGNLPYEQRIHNRGGNEESREAPPSEAASKSAFTFEEIEVNHRSKQSSSRSKSKNSGRRSHRGSEVLRPGPNDARNSDDEFGINLNHKEVNKMTRDRDTTQSRDLLEVRLDNTPAERDILRKTVSKLKAENKNQEAAILALNELVENAAVEQQRSKEKMKKKKERIEELQHQLKEQSDRFQNHERIFYDKEQKLKGKDKQLRELSDRIVKLVEENSKLRGNHGGESAQLSKRLQELEEENQELRERASKNHASQLRLKELEEKLEFYQGENGHVQPWNTGAMISENRLISRVNALERERLDISSETLNAKEVRLAETSLIENEREALKEMNASLQEHVGALKERCKHLEVAASERKELQQNVQRLESDLIQTRLERSEYHDELEQVRSEASIIESRLQTKVAKLEMELLEMQSAHNTEGSTSASIGEEKLLEERLALKTMNASLKEHITALMAKCSALEKSLAELREKNTRLTDEVRNTRFDQLGGSNSPEHELAERREKKAMLAEDLQAARFEDIGDRQKELHSEFHHLFNLVKEMATAGVGSDSTRNDEATSLENETLRNDNAGLKARCAETEAEIRQLRTELQSLVKVQESLESRSENSHLALDRMDEAGMRIGDGRGVINDFKHLENQLLEMTQRADFSERELKELKERLDLAKSTIMNLRDIISKNNGTYITKVESLTDELNDLRRANESLHSHIHDLSVENRGLRRGDHIHDVGDEDLQRQLELDELRNRLNHVAGYLIALSLILDEENAGERWFADDERRELRDELLRRQEDLLASDGREEIVQIANKVGQELRSGPRRPRSDLLSGQREELNSISTDLQIFR